MRAHREKFERFHALHKSFFVIAPTWDVMSATVLHAAGYKAIATTSVGVGFANGTTSEEVVTKDKMLDVVATICDAVDIPVSVDMESGYSDTDEGLAENVRRLIDAGAVGLNLEDNDDKPGSPLVSPEYHADRIGVIRRTAEQEGVPLFINARTDGFWIMDDVSPEEKAREAIERCNHYLKAGADGVFVSGPSIPEALIAPLAAGIEGPLNLLMQSNWPSLETLRQRGLTRLSLGSWHARAVFGYMTAAMERLRDGEDLDLLRQYAAPTKEIDKRIYAARHRS